MSKRAVFFLVLLLILVALAVYQHVGSQAPAPAPPAAPGAGAGVNDFRIVPAVRVGDIRIGGAIDEAVPRLGKVEISPRKEFLIYSSKTRGVDLGVKSDRIVMILVTSPKYRTREGLAVGDGVTPVIQAFGRSYEYGQAKAGDSAYTLDYWNSGIAFSVNRDRVVSIKVFSGDLIRALP